MIITRTPFRISFCGGGSDIADFYLENGGCVLSTSINKYMYISLHPYFEQGKTMLKYSNAECVDSLDNIQHKIFKCVLKKYNLDSVEITSTADVPAGTGLGSSSSFTVGLLNTVNSYLGNYISKPDLAKAACEVEINDLKSPIGKQDQYAAAMGGLNYISFNADDTVSIEPIIMKKETYKTLEKNLLMFYTGSTRSANNILKEQKTNIKDSDKVDNLRKMCKLAKEMKFSLEHNDLTSFGEILDLNWKLKKELAKDIANPYIDEIYDIAIKNGASGGKILGAGGGGFLLFYCEQERQSKLRDALKLKEFDFAFDHEGTSVIFIGNTYFS